MSKERNLINQGVTIKCECDKCSPFAIYYEVRFESDGRTRFYWCHSVQPQCEQREEDDGFTFATGFEVGSTTRRDPNVVLLTLYGDIDAVKGAEIAKVAIPLDRITQLTAAFNARDSASSSPVTNDPPSAAR